MKKSDDFQKAYNALIKAQNYLKPDYELWFSRAYWSTSEGCCLLNGIDPNQFETLKSVVCKEALVVKNNIEKNRSDQHLAQCRRRQSSTTSFRIHKQIFSCF